MLVSFNNFSKNNSYPAFKCTEQEVQKAYKYLNKRKKQLTDLHIKGAKRDFNNYNSQKLLPLIRDIGIFKYIKSMDQMIFLVNHLTEFVLRTGCSNRCAHCYAKALPVKHKGSENNITSIDFEDFEDLCKGLQELNKRFGFNIFSNAKNGYNTLFHNADASEVYMTSAQGKTYDYADLAKMVYDTTGKLILFDTAGWYPKTTQQRMKTLVEKVMNSDDYNFMEFIISINPFHGIYHTALQQKTPEKTEKLKSIYTSRMANVICTFLPLVNKKNIITNEPMLRFNIRALDNSTKYADGYRAEDLNSLTQEIIDKVKIILEQNNTTNIEFYINYLKDKLNNVDTEISASGRAEDLIKDKKSKSYLEYTLPFINNTPRHAAKTFNDGFYYTDRRFYITNWRETFPTDIILNFRKKGEQVDDISPNLREEVITDSMMKNFVL